MILIKRCCLIKVGCRYCGNVQEYRPRGNKISKNPSTKCKKCGNHIRVKKPLIHVQCKEVRDNYIIFEDKLEDISKHWLRMVPLDHERSFYYEIDVDLGDFKIHFQDYMVEEHGPIMFGKIYVKEFNRLDHIEVYYNRINYVFKHLEDSLEYYEKCKELSLKLKERIINVMGFKIQDYDPKLISPPDKDLLNMHIQKSIEDMKRNIEQMTRGLLINPDKNSYSKKPPDSLYI